MAGIVETLITQKFPGEKRKRCSWTSVLCPVSLYDVCGRRLISKVSDKVEKEADKKGVGVDENLTEAAHHLNLAAEALSATVCPLEEAIDTSLTQ